MLLSLLISQLILPVPALAGIQVLNGPTQEPPESSGPPLVPGSPDALLLEKTCLEKAGEYKPCCKNIDFKGCPLTNGAGVSSPAFVGGDGMRGAGFGLAVSSAKNSNHGFVRARVCQVAGEKVKGFKVGERTCGALPETAEARKAITEMVNDWLKISESASAALGEARASIESANASGNESLALKSYYVVVLGKNVDQHLVYKLGDVKAEIVANEEAAKGDLVPAYMEDKVLVDGQPVTATCSGAFEPGGVSSAGHCLEGSTDMKVYAPSEDGGLQLVDRKGNWNVANSEISGDPRAGTESAVFSQDNAFLPKENATISKDRLRLAYAPELKEGCRADMNSMVLACTKEGLSGYLDGEVVEYMGYPGEIYDPLAGPSTGGLSPRESVLRASGTGTYDPYNNAAAFVAPVSRGASGSLTYLPDQYATVNGYRYPIVVGNLSQAAGSAPRGRSQTGAEFVNYLNENPTRDPWIRVPIEVYDSDLGSTYLAQSITPERLSNSEAFMERLIVKVEKGGG